MRLLYTLLLYLLAPAALSRLLWRSRRAPGYRKRWGERFGYFPSLSIERPVWIHAVSVGEFQAAVPLIRNLLARGLPVLVTTTTPTGSQRVREVFGDAVAHVYAPYDLPGAVRRFIERARPRLAVMMETELWPNLFARCHAAGVPVIVANARLSERSAAGYRKVLPLARATLRRAALIAVQSESDARRFISIGAPQERVRVTGSIKFDANPPASLKERAAVLRREWGAARSVWIAASTHAGEDEQVLAAHAELRRELPDCLLVLVPRHPERFDDAAEACGRAGFAVARRSQRQSCAPGTAVYLGDTMGELPLFYAAADVAFVGGSLVPTGGHNPIEPAAVAVPVIAGPHTFNFADITRMLIEAGAARRVNDARELAAALRRWFLDANLRDTAGQAGRALVENNRGALRRLDALLEAYLSYTHRHES